MFKRIDLISRPIVNSNFNHKVLRDEFISGDIFQRNKIDLVNFMSENIRFDTWTNLSKDFPKFLLLSFLYLATNNNPFVFLIGKPYVQNATIVVQKWTDYFANVIYFLFSERVWSMNKRSCYRLTINYFLFEIKISLAAQSSLSFLH